MPAVKFFVRLDLDQICLFLDGHEIVVLYKDDAFRSHEDALLKTVITVSLRLYQKIVTALGRLLSFTMRH
jgi:hypothetical protein